MKKSFSLALQDKQAAVFATKKMKKEGKTGKTQVGNENNSQVDVHTWSLAVANDEQ